MQPITFKNPLFLELDERSLEKRNTTSGNIIGNLEIALTLKERQRTFKNRVEEYKYHVS